VRQEENNLKIAKTAADQERVRLLKIVERDRVEIEKSRVRNKDILNV